MSLIEAQKRRVADPVADTTVEQLVHSPSQQAHRRHATPHPSIPSPRCRAPRRSASRNARAAARARWRCRRDRERLQRNVPSAPHILIRARRDVDAMLLQLGNRGGEGVVAMDLQTDGPVGGVADEDVWSANTERKQALCSERSTSCRPRMRSAKSTAGARSCTPRRT